MQASNSVQHMVLPCHWTQRGQVISDLVRCYGAAGRTIVFTETKREANELSTSLGEKVRAQALHGDIPQNQREVCPFCHMTSKPPKNDSFNMFAQVLINGHLAAIPSHSHPQ